MAAGAFHAADVASHENESASSGLPDAAAVVVVVFFLLLNLHSLLVLTVKRCRLCLSDVASAVAVVAAAAEFPVSPSCCRQWQWQWECQRCMPHAASAAKYFV